MNWSSNTHILLKLTNIFSALLMLFLFRHKKIDKTLVFGMISLCVGDFLTIYTRYYLVVNFQTSYWEAFTKLFYRIWMFCIVYHFSSKFSDLKKLLFSPATILGLFLSIPYMIKLINSGSTINIYSNNANVVMEILVYIFNILIHVLALNAFTYSNHNHWMFISSGWFLCLYACWGIRFTRAFSSELLNPVWYECIWSLGVTSQLLSLHFFSKNESLTIKIKDFFSIVTQMKMSFIISIFFPIILMQLFQIESVIAVKVATTSTVFSIIVLILLVYYINLKINLFKYTTENLLADQLLNNENLTSQMPVEFKNPLENILKFRDDYLKKKTFSLIANQVAHDIRSPLAALNMNIRQNIKDLPEDRRVAIRQQIDRIQDIANGLLLKNKTSSTVDENILKPELISSIIEEIVTEKRLNFRHHLGVLIDSDIYSNHTYGLFSKINRRFPFFLI